VPLTRQEIEQELATLSGIVPCLLQDSRGAEFWIEFLERANAIKDRAPLGLRDWVTERIFELLARYDIAPPWRWINGGKSQSGRVYAFPSGMRLA
jgi:hypothetical protein